MTIEPFIRTANDYLRSIGREELSLEERSEIVRLVLRKVNDTFRSPELIGQLGVDIPVAIAVRVATRRGLAEGTEESLTRKAREYVLLHSR